ncbi:MAG TPA: hypothetical protein VFG10_07160 [Saprospiraceae bacterium]|nr:hypothetical protein [Saprospiraceae bacterium]
MYEKMVEKAAKAEEAEETEWAEGRNAVPKTFSQNGVLLTRKRRYNLRLTVLFLLLARSQEKSK